MWTRRCTVADALVQSREAVSFDRSTVHSSRVYAWIFSVCGRALLGHRDIGQHRSLGIESPGLSKVDSFVVRCLFAVAERVYLILNPT